MERGWEKRQKEMKRKRKRWWVHNIENVLNATALDTYEWLNDKYYEYFTTHTKRQRGVVPLWFLWILSLKQGLAHSRCSRAFVDLNKLPLKRTRSLQPWRDWTGTEFHPESVLGPVLASRWSNVPWMCGIPQDRDRNCNFIIRELQLIARHFTYI